MIPNRPPPARNGLANEALTPKQEAVALVLAAGHTLRQAARKTGAGERTIKTWLHDRPALRARVNELRAEMTARALGRLVESMASAADTLRKLLTAKSEMVRLSAARAILELASKLRESVELEERIAALEERQGQRRTA